MHTGRLPCDDEDRDTSRSTGHQKSLQTTGSWGGCALTALEGTCPPPRLLPHPKLRLLTPELRDNKLLLYLVPVAQAKGHTVVSLSLRMKTPKAGLGLCCVLVPPHNRIKELNIHAWPWGVGLRTTHLHYPAEVTISGQLQALLLRPRFHMSQLLADDGPPVVRAQSRLGVGDQSVEQPHVDEVEELGEELDGQGGIDPAASQQRHRTRERVQNVVCSETQGEAGQQCHSRRAGSQQCVQLIPVSSLLNPNPNHAGSSARAVNYTGTD